MRSEPVKRRGKARDGPRKRMTAEGGSEDREGGPRLRPYLEAEETGGSRGRARLRARIR